MSREAAGPPQKSPPGRGLNTHQSRCRRRKVHEGIHQLPPTLPLTGLMPPRCHPTLQGSFWEDSRAPSEALWMKDGGADDGVGWVPL